MDVQDYDRNNAPSEHAGMQLMHACAENMMFLDSTAKNLFSDQEAPSWAPDDVIAASEADKVQLMTIHKSKGLEFSVVFVLGLSKAGTAMKPQTGPGEDDFSMQESVKNLVYVGVTRAKDSLVVSSHYDISKNAPHGMRSERHYGAPSMFLSAMYQEFGVEVHSEDEDMNTFTSDEIHVSGNLSFRGKPSIAKNRRLGYPKLLVRPHSCMQLLFCVQVTAVVS